MKDRTILLIGGSGFLGKTIFLQLKSNGFNVHYADLKPIDGFENNFIELDILEKKSFLKLNSNYDFIVNLTGQTTRPSNLCVALNSEGLSNIIDFVNKNNIRLIQMSTLSVYGSSENKIDENNPLNPETVYGSCKVFSEFLIKKNLKKGSYIIIRLSNLYGNNQPKGMIAYILRSISQNDTLFFNNDGSLSRHLLHVKDASRLIVKILSEFVPGVYNYAGIDKYSVRDLIALSENNLNRKLNVVFEDSKAWENIGQVDSNKVLEAFNIKPEIHFHNWFAKQIKNL
jgi:UDP-glucose 4-epimerase